jgi:hypothetical protein
LSSGVNHAPSTPTTTTTPKTDGNNCRGCTPRTLLSGAGRPNPPANTAATPTRTTASISSAPVRSTTSWAALPAALTTNIAA